MENADKLVGKYFIVFNEHWFNYGKILDHVDSISYFVRMLSWERPATVLYSKIKMQYDGIDSFFQFYDSEEEMRKEVEWLSSPREKAENNITTFRKKV